MKVHLKAYNFVREACINMSSVKEFQFPVLDPALGMCGIDFLSSVRFGFEKNRGFGSVSVQF